MQKILIQTVALFSFLHVACQSAAVQPDDLYHSEELSFGLELVAEGLEIPWGMAFLPGNDILVTERKGTLRLIRNGELLSEPIAGVPEVYARGQGGLLDIVLHPEYEMNGWIYLSYAVPGPGGGHTALMRAKLDGHSLKDQEVLFTGSPFSSAGQHFGSRIAFDNDHFVYLSIGDRGARDEAQNPQNYHGVVIRLHDDGRIPEDNPFVGHPDYRPEIYAYGTRNIQGMVKHPITGEIWSHEHGPRGGDEINVIRKGKNYGWPKVTHGRNYSGTMITPDTTLPGMEDPLHHWTPSIAPSGLAIVHGNRYPAWDGNLMVGALRRQKIERVVLSEDKSSVIHRERLLQNIGRVRDVRMGPDGFLYFAEESAGRIFRIVPK